MRVIERGKVPEQWRCEAKCSGAGHGEGGCGSLLDLEEDDLFPGLDGVTAFACPLCGVWSALEGEALEKLPKSVIVRLPFRLPRRM